MTYEPSPHTEFKEDREDRICQLIRRVGSQSSQEIGRTFGLNAATVSPTLKKLVEGGLLEKHKGFAVWVFDLTKKGREYALKKKT